ncbi:MAG: hypothetical protein ACO33A_11920 [Hyphomonas sp.]
MSDRDDLYPPRSDARRFSRWLSTRPAESWIFFAAGLLFGGVFF